LILISVKLLAPDRTLIYGRIPNIRIQHNTHISAKTIHKLVIEKWNLMEKTF